MIVGGRQDLSPGGYWLDPRELRKKKSGTKVDSEKERGSMTGWSLVGPKGLKKEKEWD